MEKEQQNMEKIKTRMGKTRTMDETNE